VSPPNLSRREWLKQASLLGAAAPLGIASLPAISQLGLQAPEQLIPREATPGLPAKLFAFDPSLYRFTADEDVFLDDIEQASGSRRIRKPVKSKTGDRLTAARCVTHRAWRQPDLG